ncbi:MAG: type III pantothenate kinase [Burkholderiales bacterium]
MALLLVDAGNSRVKWGAHDGDAWLQQGVVENVDIARLSEAWKAYTPPQLMVVSNVAGEKVRSALRVLSGRWAVDPHWVQPKAAQCGVCNRYEAAEKLGADRWAALIGAWNLFQRSCLIVNVGTAMTVDALSDEGVFLGGIIVAGPDLMRAALSSKAPVIGQPRGKFASFPTNTADAVYSGAWMALSGAVERMLSEMQQSEMRQPLCVLSGGAAALLQTRLNVPTRIVENLVLEGLVRIALERAATRENT